MRTVHQTLAKRTHSSTKSDVARLFRPQFTERSICTTRDNDTADSAPRKPPRSASECNWASYPFEFLIRSVVEKQHDEIMKLLFRLQDVAETVARAQRSVDRRCRNTATHLTGFINELIDDMAEEERIFPDLLHLELAYVGAAPCYSPRLCEMLNRFACHSDQHLQQLDRIRKEARNIWPDIYCELGILETALLDHLHVERDIVFRRAASMESELARYSR
jgi:iron-sulfur cluster repair protein YtfE (RIC family)